jgi:hypothetical protein
VDRREGHPLEKALPPSATEIRTWEGGEEGPLAQDFYFMMKARITREEFEAYVEDMEMTLHTDEREYDFGFNPDWSSNSDVNWWIPSPELDETYVRDDGSAWTYSKYENGFIWVVSYNI